MNFQRYIISLKCQKITWKILPIFMICFWIVWYNIPHNSRPNEKFSTKEIIKLVSNNINYTEIIRRSDKFREGIKYVLLWTREDYYPFHVLGNGQRVFIDSHCPTINCYVTSNRNKFGGNLEKFHAIAFNYRNMQVPVPLPKRRSPNQIYIFVCTESADNFPICFEEYNGFFNWTATYKLDSELSWTYFSILNTEGQVIGPKKEMQWKEYMGRVDEATLKKIYEKNKLAAWFVSNCAGRSNRREYVDELDIALQSYNSSVDIVGKCGTKKCPINKKQYCSKLLEKYFFYLAFENSIAEDYVSEKVVTALQNMAVPIVYGGANYTRFLPPGSYLDARAHTPKELARLMIKLMHSPELYSQFFTWRNHYRYVDYRTNHACLICNALNNKSLTETTRVYEDLRSWWNPDYKERCFWYS